MTDTAAAPTLRLFLGLWPPAHVREALEAHASRWSWPPAARRTPADRLHATLHFLGAIPAARVADLREPLALAWEGCELLLDRAQVWPGGIAVLEAQAVPAPLANLHAALGGRLRELGIPVETRPYRPHVTFARKAFGARAPARFEPLRWRLGPHYLLVQSLPGGRGYLPLQRFG